MYSQICPPGDALWSGNILSEWCRISFSVLRTCNGVDYCLWSIEFRARTITDLCNRIIVLSLSNWFRLIVISYQRLKYTHPAIRWFAKSVKMTYYRSLTFFVKRKSPFWFAQLSLISLWERYFEMELFDHEG